MLVTGVLFSVVMYNTGRVPDGLTAKAETIRQNRRVVSRMRRIFVYQLMTVNIQLMTVNIG